MQSRLFFSTLGRPFLRGSMNTLIFSGISASRVRLSLLSCRFLHSRQLSLQSHERSVERNGEQAQIYVGGGVAKMPEQATQIPSSSGLPTIDSWLATNARRRRRKMHKPTPSSPLGALSHWLNLEDDLEKQKYFKGIRHLLRPSSLQNILLRQLHLEKHPKAEDPFPRDSTDIILDSLRKRGFGEHDVTRWAWILSGKEVDEMLNRLVSEQSTPPIFVLLHILRRNIWKVHSLKRAIEYVWERILKVAPEDPLENVLAHPHMKSSFHGSSMSLQALAVDDDAFMRIISSLSFHTRRIWPAAIPSVSYMIRAYMYSAMDRGSARPRVLDARTHRKFCKIYNDVMHLLALPSSIEPLKSMAYNWSAQKVILELGDEFEPPLLPNENSYRAVIHIMAALNKSAKESHVTTLRSRSWPPWRVAQDGMDAQRSPEEDMSRVAMAIAKKRSAGYIRTFSQDEALNIIGGQDFDGTPTIHTRKLAKVRSGRQRGILDPSGLDPKQWAARIEATRDIWEAWSVFVEYQDRGAQPTMTMYGSMFVKLTSEGARIGRSYPYEAAPGDGREVLPIADDNLSTSYRLLCQPPTIEALYDQMIRSGIRPSGQCLIHLIRHARSITQGLHVIRDSKLVDEAALSCLSDFTNSSTLGGSLEGVPMPVFTAWIHLLCRFTPTMRGNEAATPLNGPLVSRMIPTRGFFPALLHAARLLKLHRTPSRPTWYMLFQALAQRNTIIARDETNHAKNDVLSWQVLAVALQNFHVCGLELDPRGFQIICYGFCKAALASKAAGGHSEEEILRDVALVKAEFAKISTSRPGPYQTPRLFHPLGGVHLHAYVRVLGVTKDLGGVVTVLKWMIDHHKELDASARPARNGARHIRQVLVAMRSFLCGTNYEQEAERLVGMNWGGWPEDSEVAQYLERSPTRRSAGQDNE